LNSHDPQTFIKGFFERLNIRKLVTGLVAQPTIKGLLTSTLMKSPQIVLDLGKMLLSSLAFCQGAFVLFPILVLFLTIIV
jgi:hypothetical protein